MADQLGFACDCDIHLHHGICNEDCPCIEKVAIRKRHLLRGDFAIVEITVRLDPARVTTPASSGPKETTDG